MEMGGIVRQSQTQVHNVKPPAPKGMSVPLAINAPAGQV